MRILVLSNTEWADDNSFGSTFSNIFGEGVGYEIANIYCTSKKPNTKASKFFFQISERSLLKNISNSDYSSGKLVAINPTSVVEEPEIFNVNQSKLVNFIRRKRWIPLFWIRDIIWFLGRWKSIELKKFIDDFKPDIIFLPIYYSVYLNKIGVFLKEYINVPMVGNISDDNYTLRQYSLNPLYWIDRFIKRRWVKKAIDYCEILYVISDVQKKDYDRAFKRDCKLLYKGGLFTNEAPVKTDLNKPISIVFTGNIYAGRYISLGMIGTALDNINDTHTKAVLHIYSQTPLTGDMKKQLNKKSIVFHGGIPSSEVKKVQEDADILVHAESFQLKERLLVRHSFSTKIVDYLQAARCVLAIGWPEAASIDYLIQHDAAVVATNQREVEEKLTELVNKPELIRQYASKAWELGKRNHQIEKIRSGLINDMKNLVETNLDINLKEY